MRLKRLYPILFLIVALLVTKSVTANVVDKPYLYKVSRQGIEPSYILGSIHIGVGLQNLPNWVQTLHSNASMHVYEFLEKDFMKTYAELKKAHNPNHLSEIIREKQEQGQKPVKYNRKQVATLMKLGVPEPFIDYLEDSNCLLAMFAKYIFQEQFKSIDFELMETTIKTNTPYLNLDTDELFEKAASLSTFHECKVSKDLQESPELIIDFVNSIIDDYFAGNIDLEAPYDENDIDAYLRNKAWIPKLIPVLEKGNAFITFGHGHLGTDQGVIHLLRQEGYKFERVLTNPL